MRTIGSSSGLYADPGILLSERATRLLRDTANAIHERILDEYTEPSDTIFGSSIIESLDQFLDAANTLIIDGALTREEAQQIVKGEHLRILQTDLFSITERELLLLGLWYLLHEISNVLSEEGSFADLFGIKDLSFLEVPLSTRLYEEYTTPAYQKKIDEILAQIEDDYPDVYANFMNQPPTDDVPVEEDLDEHGEEEHGEAGNRENR